MELQRRSDQAPILTADELCLRLYPFNDWCDLEEKIVARAEVDPNAQDYVRMVVSGAVEAPIDKQGRILVPAYLREHAHLEKEVTLAGVGHTVEIWDTGRLQSNLDQTRGVFRRVASKMAEDIGS
jgi:MraZ protein